MRNVFILLFLSLSCNLFSQYQADPEIVAQDYTGVCLVPFTSNEEFSYVKKEGNVVKLVGRKKNVLEISKGEILDVYYEVLNKGVGGSLYKVCGLYVKLPVKEDVFSVWINEGQKVKSLRIYKTMGMINCEMHYYDSAKKEHVFDFRRKKMESPIDGSSPITMWVVEYNGTKRPVTQIDLVEFGVMYNSLPSPVVGSQFSKGQVERIKQQVARKEEFIINVYYNDSNGQSQIFQCMGYPRLWRFSNQ